MAQNYEKYMQRCIDLARNGKGSTAPNPMVGSILVCNDKIIGEGYHKVYGGPHAEVNAINSVKYTSLLSQSTLYVTLEPCAHSGKTPPCSDLIIKMNIPKVVVGTIDPHSVVAGKGIEKMKAAGIDIVSDILPKECMELNKAFFTYHKYKRPYIILKWAQSADGYIDIERSSETPIGPNWISNALSRKLVHKWRSEEMAIMAGTNTFLMDNPSLTTRYWKGKSPVRIVLDRTLRLPTSLKVFDKEVPTIVFTELEKDSVANLEYNRIDFNREILPQILDVLYRKNIQSLIVEGGRKLLNSFINKGLWDEARVFCGTSNFTKGVEAPFILGEPHSESNIGGDKLLLYSCVNDLL